MKKFPHVGAAVFVRKEGKVLMGLREGFGSGTWCAPGGHIELNEKAIECVVRETKEESGVEIANIRFLNIVETIWPEEGTHYITLMYVADWKSGEPRAQPEEFQRWEWHPWDNLPSPLFRPTASFVAEGINPLEV